MILLIGGGGYVGAALARELTRREIDFFAPSRRDLNCNHFGALLTALRRQRPEFVINAAGYTGKPNVDVCETQRAETILGNVVLPQAIADACAMAEVLLGTVSSGCIFSGAKFVDENGVETIETDLNAPNLQKGLQARSSQIKGFAEDDAANFSFGQNNCSFYSGTKAIGEKILSQFPDFFIWRLRIPFEEEENSRNYLSKIQRYPKVYQNWNSISHLGDFVSACLDTWQLGLPGGTYNVVNPGYISTREVVELVRKYTRADWHPEFWENDAEFYRVIARSPRSNCLLDVQKIVQAGVKIRPVDEALETSLRNWRES